MERDISQAFCRCGCGFYGNPATDGMCSKCYKDAMKRKQAPPASSTTSNNSTSSISNQISSALSSSFNETATSNAIASIAAALNSTTSEVSAFSFVLGPFRERRLDLAIHCSNCSDYNRSKTRFYSQDAALSFNSRSTLFHSL